MSTPQRRENLIARRAQLESERADLESEMDTASIARLVELNELIDRKRRSLEAIDRELGAATIEDQQTAAYRRAVDHLAQWAGDMQRDLRQLDSQIQDHQRRLDARLDDLHDLMRAGADAQAASMRLVYGLLFLVMAGEMMLGAAVFWLVQHGA